MSTITLTRFLSVRMVSAGSVWETPSTSPFSIAAMTEAPAPTPIATTSLAFSPPFAAQKFSSMWVERAGRRDAELHALDVGRALHFGGHVVAQRDADLHAAADQGEARDVLSALLHADGVLVGAGDHVGAAAHQGLQRLGAALEVVDLDVDACLLEEALALGDGQREVIEGGLAADREDHLALLGLALGARDIGRSHHHRGGRQQGPAPNLQLGHCFLRDRLLFRQLAARAPSRQRRRQNIPFGLAALSGTICSTSQCSTILPSSSSRKMSMPAQT